MLYDGERRKAKEAEKDCTDNKLLNALVQAVTHTLNQAER
jgi:hypothetical protein